MTGDKVIVIERCYRRYQCDWQLHLIYSIENKPEAKEFVKLKRANNNCEYDYRHRTVTTK